MSPEDIINDWALASCETLEVGDVEAHMNLISKYEIKGGGDN